VRASRHEHQNGYTRRTEAVAHVILHDNAAIELGLGHRTHSRVLMPPLGAARPSLINGDGQID
jgi:hypothetical protein